MLEKRLERSPLLMLALWAFAMALAWSIFWAVKDRQLQSTFLISTTGSGTGQLFYSRSQAFSEARSIRFEMRHDGAPQRYRVPIESPRPSKWLRFDPGASPGEVTVYRIDIDHGSRNASWSGRELRDRVTVIQDLEVVSADQQGLSLRSTGDDPALGIRVPGELRKIPHERIGLAGALLILLLATLALIARTSWRLYRSGISPTRHSLPLFLSAGFVLLLAALGVLPAWRPTAALSLGGPLWLAGLAFSIVGAAWAATFHAPHPVRQGLFVWLLLGQALLMVYMLVRSWIHSATGQLPLSFYELIAIVIISAGVLVRRRGAIGLGRSSQDLVWLTAQAGLLLAICMLVADRELPRLVMLSSDPDQHAYFALQVQRLGGLPWGGLRSGPPFHYPGGSAVLGAAWSWLSGLDPRNALTALPWIVFLCGALAIAETAAEKLGPSRRAIVSLAVVGVLVAGFMLPLYRHFVHQEGLGRILGFGFLSLLAACLLSRDITRSRSLQFTIATASVAALGALNPVNLGAAGLVLGAYFLFELCRRNGQAAVLAALPVGLALAMIDPYYIALLRGEAIHSGLSLDPRLGQTDLRAGVVAGLRAMLAAPWAAIADATRLLPSAGWLGLAVPIATGALVLAAVRPPRSAWPCLAAIAGALLVMAATLSISRQFAQDARFYLLAPYLDVAYAQVRIATALALTAWAIALAAEWLEKKSSRTIAWSAVALLAGALVWTTSLAARQSQEWWLTPKWNHCGGLICPHPDDVATLEAFADSPRTGAPMPRADSSRVLVINSVRHLGNESWLMPVGGARLIPFMELPDPAFFYFQGDDAFTTENYDAHVCRRLDLDWLKARGIGYIFLPAQRDQGCIAGMDRLIQTEDIVANVGDAYIVRLR